MNQYVVRFRDIDPTQIAVAGGKGAHLGELSRLEGVRVPPGFCVTTEAFRRILATVTSITDPLDRLSRLRPEDRESIRATSAEIRRLIEDTALPDDMVTAITDALAQLGEDTPCAVRSSATSEDSPTASFAGQQDTYLNVVGRAAILDHVRRCWASLYSERAVIYRLRNGFDHRKIQMAVVVQQMVFPEAAGVLFTADPVTSNRKVASVEAAFGLGEALVSGRVDADVYKVRDGHILSREIRAKRIAVHASPGGGTREDAVDPERQSRPALTDPQVVRLVGLGRQIEAHLGGPQDIEWCLVGDDFHIVQSRPITTLFPVPATSDQENRVYISVGHQQMMTDAMKPLGISLFLLTTPAPMHEAGGRLFVDVTRGLASPASRTGLLAMVGRSDPLIRDALETIVARGDFLRTPPDEGPTAASPLRALPGAATTPIETDPTLVSALIERALTSIAVAKSEIGEKSGEALIDFLFSDLQELKRILFDPQSHQAIMAGIESTWWLDDHLREWLGESSAADALAQSAPNNVTSEMGLALLDVADAIRPHRDVVAYLRRARDEDFLDHLPELQGGSEARDAILAYLEKYGARGVGEIDLTRPRFRERPTTLLPLILANVDSFEPGAAKRRFEQGEKAARAKEEELLRRLQALPDGETKAEEVQRKIDRVRTFIGYREFPKYGMISRYFVYKEALLGEADRLVQAGVLAEREDLFYLTLPEIRDVVRTGRADEALLRRRKEAFRWHRTLTPPRVLTSEGEALSGSYRRTDLPPGALVGLPVSAGIVEGRARVVLEIGEANLQAGDILVTTYTDPSWTPAFVAIAGLVTEVGGLMTHGAVIAREYGLPAVVGVEHATRKIQDGQRIRVHGTLGYIEILP